MSQAVDLGMNRNADNWTTDGTQPIFTDVEKQIRKHIWWSCCISDKYVPFLIVATLGSMYHMQAVCRMVGSTDHLPCKRLLHCIA